MTQGYNKVVYIQSTKGYETNHKCYSGEYTTQLNILISLLIPPAFYLNVAFGVVAEWSKVLIPVPWPPMV